ncbi:MAG: amidase [Kordiimonadaceae bacterium]|nr:amidase [Kordiimonadaceae bacterium]
MKKSFEKKSIAGKAFGRRQFLKTGGAAGGLLMTAAVMAQDQTVKPVLNGPSELKIAERLVDLNYTDAERASIYESLDSLVDRVRARRSDAPLANADLPALTFNPLLAGQDYKQQKNSVILAAQNAGPLPADEDIAFAPIWKQGKWLRSGQLTANRLTDIYLQRIKKLAPKLECFVTVTEYAARTAAQKADIELRSGKDRGPLHGIPYGLKDLTDTAGIRTTWGAEPYKDRVATEDAVIVKRLRDAGAILLGKTTLGALAYGDRWFGGLTRNPWDTDEGSSGSSAGSASATGGGLCGFAIGSETLGSIVSPSSRCGATGLRPTFGRVPRTGVMALCWSLDKLGPLCRSVEDTALVLGALNGADDSDPSSIEWGFEYDGPTAAGEDIKIGYDPAWFETATASDKAVLTHLRNMGFKLTEIKLPDMPYGSLLTTLDVEAAAAFEELTLSNKDDLLKWQEDRAWPNTFRSAHFISAVEALQVDRFRRKVMEMMAGIYEQVDVIVCPNFTGDLLVITNYTGTPSLTLPVGMEERQSVGRIGEPTPDSRREKSPHPHAITLWGNMFREDQLLAVGRLLEESLRFSRNRPDLSA